MDETAVDQQTSNPAESRPEWITVLGAERDPAAISDAIIRAIQSRNLEPGTRLPTVRRMAQWIGVSPSTVAAAWARLRAAGYVETRRRGGTHVVEPDHKAAEKAAEGSLLGPLDLSQASSDPRLQPDLAAALLAGLRAPKLHDADLDYIIDPLKQKAIADWPFEAQEWLVAGASSESVLLALAGVTRPGDAVAVEQPTSPRLLKILERLGLRPIAVNWDGNGPRPDELETALEEGARTFIYQPRAHLPLGLSVAGSRIEELTAVLRSSDDVAIIEDDPLGPLCTIDAPSLGGQFPDRTVLVRSYCKAFGLDLRASIIGGSAKHLKSIRTQRSHGLGMASRILQGALHHLLTDDLSIRRTEAARRQYAERRAALSGALRRNGIDAPPGGEGLLLWVPVDDDRRVALWLAERKILVGRGSACFVTPHHGHVALGIGGIDGSTLDIETIARCLSDAMLHASSPADFRWD